MELLFIALAAIAAAALIWCCIGFSCDKHEREVSDFCKRSEEMLARVKEQFDQLLIHEPPNNNTRKYAVPSYPFNDLESSTHIWLSGSDLMIVFMRTGILTSYINDTLNRQIMGDIMRSRLAEGPNGFLRILRIPVNNIQYFWRDGDVSVTQQISGGGVNMGGAIAGGLLAGSAGAVIGSRVGTNIKTETKSCDLRHVVLMYTDKDGASQHISLGDGAYDALMHLIPEKEYSQAVALKASTTKTPSIEDKLKQLKSLLDQNLITQDEYNAKRQDILNQL